MGYGNILANIGQRTREIPKLPTLMHAASFKVCKHAATRETLEGGDCFYRTGM